MRVLELYGHKVMLLPSEESYRRGEFRVKTLMVVPFDAELPRPILAQIARDHMGDRSLFLAIATRHSREIAFKWGCTRSKATGEIVAPENLGLHGWWCEHKDRFRYFVSSQPLCFGMAKKPTPPDPTTQGRDGL
jgi:hypothetical protein